MFVGIKQFLLLIRICIYLSVVLAFYSLLASCANIVPPGGGPRDSLPPRLINAVPKDSGLNINTNKITLTFDEYVQLDNAQQNIIVSPNPKNTPIVESRLKTVTVKLRDTLEPNTTYSINFRSTIKDINEGNPLSDFNYVFSTGAVIHQGALTGKVVLAETGKIDSTLIVVLHTNLEDSAVTKYTPRYYTLLNRDGNFRFNNLPSGKFAVYALTNNYGKKYDDSTALFAFVDSAVTIDQENTTTITLNAYQEAKKQDKTSTINTANRNTNTTDKSLRYTTNLNGNKQDLLSDLQLTFNRKLQSLVREKIILTDTSNNLLTIPFAFFIDTSNTILNMRYPWQENQTYQVIIPKDAVADSAGINLPKSDTIIFQTNKEAEYGSIRFRFRFKNINLDQNPVVQLVQNDKIVESFPLTSSEWYRKLYKPGEYEMRILYDQNKNGVWDAGKFFGEKRQPEIVKPINQKISIKANWDNEIDISL